MAGTDRWLFVVTACAAGLCACGGRVESDTTHSDGGPAGGGSGFGGTSSGGVGGIGGFGGFGGFGGTTGGSGGTAGCGGGLSLCGGVCVDLQHNPLNCGQCQNACGDEESCIDGKCGCPISMANCGGLCVDIANDPTNCGQCGFACAPGQTCTLGVCAGATCCSDSQNDGAAPYTNCFHGVTWIAWRYQPSCSIDVTAITLHTDGGSVALLTDASGEPGAVLGIASLPFVSPPSWTTGTFGNPILLAGGQTYWIAEAVSVCSQTVAGVSQPYYGGSSLSGPWDGPFTDAFWTSKLTGACPL